VYTGSVLEEEGWAAILFGLKGHAVNPDTNKKEKSELTSKQLDNSQLFQSFFHPPTHFCVFHILRVPIPNNLCVSKRFVQALKRKIGF
jgi:hypothetical protein